MFVLFPHTAYSFSLNQILFVIVIVITLTPLNSLELLMNTQVQHYTHNFALIEGTWIRKDSNTLHASTYIVTSISGSLNNS